MRLFNKVIIIVLGIILILLSIFFLYTPTATEGPGEGQCLLAGGICMEECSEKYTSSALICGKELTCCIPIDRDE